MSKLLGFLIYLYFQLVFYSSKWTGRLTYTNQHIIDESVERHLKQGHVFILAFWHGRLAMMPKLSTRPHRTNVMISQHRDGQLIADVCRYFGLGSVRGSSNRAKSDPKGAKNRGGTRALVAALSTFKTGGNIAITPDGPKGPRMRLQEGVVHLARSSNVPVIPASFSAGWAKEIPSWDRFLLPYPFSRIVILIGEPIQFPKEQEEALKTGRVLENTLNQLTIQADKAVGRKPVLPA